MKILTAGQLRDILEFGGLTQNLTNNEIDAKCEYLFYLFTVNKEKTKPKIKSSLTPEELVKKYGPVKQAEQKFKDVVDAPMNLHEKTVAEAVGHVISLHQKPRDAFIKGLVYELIKGAKDEDSFEEWIENLLTPVWENHPRVKQWKLNKLAEDDVDELGLETEQDFDINNDKNFIPNKVMHVRV